MFKTSCQVKWRYLRVLFLSMVTKQMEMYICMCAAMEAIMSKERKMSFLFVIYLAALSWWNEIFFRFPTFVFQNHTCCCESHLYEFPWFVSSLICCRDEGFHKLPFINSLVLRMTFYARRLLLKFGKMGPDK